MNQVIDGAGARSRIVIVGAGAVDDLIHNIRILPCD